MAKPRRSDLTGYSREQRSQERQNKNESAREFGDLPRSGFSYHGDGQEQVDFFNAHSNYNELIEAMPQRDRDKFDDVWVPGTFMGGAQYQGFENMSPSLQSATRTFDKWLDRSVVDRSFVVNRLATAELVLGAGNTTGTLAQFQAMKGQTVISIGNLSTGVAKQGLTIGSTLSTKSGGWRTKSVEYKITIPGGSKGAGMWIGDSRINSGFGRDQREFMMNRDIRLKVGNTTHDKVRDVYVVELTYAGRLPHNYTHY